MTKNYDYTTGNLSDYLYHQNYFKFIGIDLSRQANTSIPQQINFTGKFKEDDGATMLFIAEKLQKNNSKWNIEHQKILNLLNEAKDSKFVTRK